MVFTFTFPLNYKRFNNFNRYFDMLYMNGFKDGADIWGPEWEHSCLGFDSKFMQLRIGIFFSFSILFYLLVSTSKFLDHCGKCRDVLFLL